MVSAPAVPSSAEGGAIADLVDQPGRQRGVRHVSAGRGDPVDRGIHIIGQPRLGPRPPDIVLPILPQRPRHRRGGLARFGRHVGARVRLDRRLVGSGFVDIGGDPQFVEQALIIKIGSARTGDEDAAQWIEPDFGGVGGDLIGIVAIAGGVGDDRLVGPADGVDRVADPRQAGLAAAQENVEIEGDGLHPVVGRRRLQRVDDVAQPIFADQRGSRHDFQRIGLDRLLDDRATEVEQKGALVGAAGIRRGGEQGIEKAEEEQHENEHQPVLHAHQQPPRLAQKTHVCPVRDSVTRQLGHSREPVNASLRRDAVARRRKNLSGRPLTPDGPGLNPRHWHSPLLSANRVFNPRPARLLLRAAAAVHSRKVTHEFSSAP